MRKVCIAGVGQTRRGFFPDKSMTDLCVEAAFEALDDASLTMKDVEGIWFSHYPAQSDMQFTASHIIVDALGVAAKIGCTETVKACSGGAVAFHNAYLAVASGYHDVALVLAVTKAVDSFKWIDVLQENSFNPIMYQIGIPDALSGTITQNYVRKYVTEEDIYSLYTTWFWYAVRWPKSMCYRESYIGNEKSEYMKIPYSLNYPFRFGTGGSRRVDGASAMVLTSESVARKYIDTPVHVVASVMKDDSLYHPHRIQITGQETIVKEVWKEAFRMAKVDVTELDVFQPHQNQPIKTWTHPELIGHPDIKPGCGPKWYTTGQAMPGGKLPMITAGLAKGGYAPGAQALDQVIENCNQLIGRAGERQVPIKHGVAASIVSTYRTCAQIIRRP